MTPSLSTLCNRFLVFDVLLSLLVKERFLIITWETKRLHLELQAWCVSFFYSHLGFLKNIPMGSTDCLLGGEPCCFVVGW
jgi:hypothetical protein